METSAYGFTLLYAIEHFEIGEPDDPDDAEEHRVIGVFSSEARAKQAIALLSEKRGFRRWPGGFRICESDVDRLRYPPGQIHAAQEILGGEGVSFPVQDPLRIVYEATFLRLRAGETFDTYRDDLLPTAIGEFSSHELAEAAVESLKDHEDFRDWPDGFRITERVIDEPAYPDGY